MNVQDLIKSVDASYATLTSGSKAFVRDINQLLKLGALHLKEHESLPGRGFYSSTL